MGITKRYNAPVFWPIKRKGKKFTVTPSPGPHSKNLCVPLAILIRDYLGIAKNIKEVKTILSGNNVKVNGKTRKEYKFPVGLMDVIQIGDMFFITLPSKNGLTFVKTKSQLRLAKVRNKKLLKGGRIQLNLHDGTNLLTKDKEIKTNDVLVLDLENKIKDVVKFEPGALIMIINGSNAGKFGYIKDLIKRKDCKENIVVIEINDSLIEVPLSYTFVVGRDKPLIPLKADGESDE